MPPCAAFFMAAVFVKDLSMNRFFISIFSIWHAALYLLLTMLFVGCEKQPIQFTGKTMGASYHVTVVDLPETKNAKSMGRDIAEILADAHARMTTYESISELGRFNEAPINEWQSVSPLLYSAIKISMDVAKSTNGDFDPTVLPLVILWGFGPGEHHDRVPDDAEIAALKKHIGYRYLELDNAKDLRARKTQPIKIDLSGIGHGYGADLVADYLDKNGVKNYLAEVAGEMRTKGHRADGKFWRIAIEKPVDMQGEVFQGLEPSDMGLATSGDYRNFFMKDGVRYSHTIDPESGRPVKHALASVTVLDKSAARADALATAIMVMGPDKGRSFANKKHVPAYFIVRDGKAFRGFFSDAFKPFMKL